jgi:hypothetical protein
MEKPKRFAVCTRINPDRFRHHYLRDKPGFGIDVFYTSYHNDERDIYWTVAKSPDTCLEWTIHEVSGKGAPPEAEWVLKERGHVIEEDLSRDQVLAIEVGTGIAGIGLCLYRGPHDYAKRVSESNTRNANDLIKMKGAGSLENAVSIGCIYEADMIIPMTDKKVRFRTGWNAPRGYKEEEIMPLSTPLFVNFLRYVHKGFYVALGEFSRGK